METSKPFAIHLDSLLLKYPDSIYVDALTTYWFLMFDFDTREFVLLVKLAFMSGHSAVTGHVYDALYLTDRPAPPEKVLQPVLVPLIITRYSPLPQNRSQLIGSLIISFH